VIKPLKTKKLALLLIISFIFQILSPGISIAADDGFDDIRQYEQVIVRGHATDPMYSDQWALEFEQVEVYKAWDTVDAALNGSPPETVVVAVLDTGVDAGHEDLAGRVLDGRNFISGVPDPADTSDTSGHGTAVAGIIAASANNGLGIAGAAGEFPVKILPVKVLQNNLSGTVSDIAYGINWAVDWTGPSGEKVKVINLSFGERLSEFPQTLNDALQYAIDNDVVVIAAAGNDSGSVSGFYPADLDGVVSVGAADRDHIPDPSSNTGADIMAPGVDILTTVTDSVYKYQTRTGTSFAAGFASAAAALLRTAYPAESAETITSALLASEKEYKEWINEAEYEWYTVINADKALKVMEPPGAPQNLAYMSNDSNVQLTWSEPGGWVSWENNDYDLAAYRIYRDGVLIAEITETESTYEGDRVLTGYTDSGLTPATTYQYTVTAVDAVGNESGSASLTAETESAVSVNTTRVSVSASGAEADNYNEDRPVISADGRYVAFVSDAGNLVDNDTNAKNDVFVHDRETGTVERVSVTSDGIESTGWIDGFDSDMSSDGRFVVFYVIGGNLSPNGSGIYVHDRQTGETRYITTGDYASISDDGRYIVTTSSGYIYLFDRDSDNNGIFDEADGTAKQNIATGENSSISADGRHVVYNKNSGGWGIYVYDIFTGNHTRVDVSASGVPADSDSYFPAISGSGRYVVFLSWSSNLLDEYVDYDQHIYVHDRDADNDGLFDETSDPGGVSNEMVDVSSGGTPGNDYVGDYMAISDNGRYVAFKSSADNLVYGDTNESEDVFLRDLLNGKTMRMNVSSGGVQSTTWWMGDYLSVSDTGAVAYQSDATNLVDGDTNGDYDIFVSEPGFGLPVWPAGSELTTADVGQTFAQLEWTPAQHGVAIDSYRLVESQQVMATVDGATTGYMVQNLQPDSEYTFRVDAADSVGNWVYGPSVTFATSASSGTASLLVDMDPGGIANLQWDAAPPESPAAAYAIWRAESGGTLEQAAEVPLGTTDYQDTGLAAGTEYSYVIRIITGDQSQLDHTEQVTAATSQIFVSGIQWGVPRTINGLARLEESLNILLSGETNRQAVAEVTYQAYDINGSLQNETFNVSLTEDPEQAGMYEGTFVLAEGTAEIISIKGILTDGAGSEVTRETGSIALGVSGSLVVNILCDAPDILTGAKLSAWSNLSGSGDQRQIFGAEIYELKGLSPSGDYRLEVTGPDSVFRVTKDAPVVAAGRKENVDLNVPSPSLLQVEVADENGDPVPSITLDFYDDTGFMGRFLTGRLGIVPLQLSYASQVRAKVNVGNLHYYNREYTIDLQPGSVDKTLVLEPLPTGTLKGYITNTEGQPIEGINVSVSQSFERRSFSFSAVSDANGYYEAVVLAGDAWVNLGDRVGRYELVGDQEINLTIPSGGEEQLDLTFNELEGYGEVHLNVYTKYLGGEWMGPLDLDNSAASHMGLSTKGGTRTGPVSPLVFKNVAPGSEITISFSGKEGGLSPQSKTVVLDEKLRASVEFRLAEKGRIVAGLLDAYTDEPPAGLRQGESLSGTYTLFEVDSDGQRKRITSRPFHYLAGSSVYDKLKVSVPDAGTYDLTISLNVPKATIGVYDVLYGSTRVDVPENQIVELSSPIILAKKGFFAGEENYLHALPGDAVPGGIINLRTVYKNTGKHPYGNSIWVLDDSQLLLDLPQGTTLVANSVMLNGQPAQGYSVSAGGVLQVPVGYLDIGESGIMDCKLQVSPNIDSSITALNFSARMAFSYGAANNLDSMESQETIGSSVVKVPGITIAVPAKLDSPETIVSGKAPAGSTVKVFDRNFPVGEAEASQGGLWKLNAALPDFGNPAWHLLRAETQYNGQELQSEKALARFDNTKPKITGFTMQQTDGRKMSFNPQETGTARFPYVFRPSHHFLFTVEFDQPERVYNAKIRIGDNTSFNLYAQEDNFRGWTLLNINYMPGPIYVSYETLPAEDAFRQPAPSEEQLRLGMPLWASDYQVLPEEAGVMSTQSVPDPFQGPVSSTERVNLPGMEDTEVEYTRTIECGMNYTPTFAAMQFVQETGVPVYGFNFSHRPVAGGTEITLSGYIPFDKIRLENNEYVIAGNDQVLHAASSVIWTHVKDVAKVGMDLYDYKGLAEWPWDAMDARDKLDALLEMSEDCSSGGNFYRDWIEDISTDMLIGDVSNGLLGIAGVVFAPVTFGGSVAMFGVSLAMSEAVDAKINKSIENVKEAIGADPDCRRDKDSDNNHDDEDDGNRVADPTWIWDPSGYVYEVAPENRIEGVTATALYQDETTGEWVFWDAEWYEQENPQLTDSEGKYAWDVPPGLWQVSYQKQGYDPALSDAMTVPPPRTEVNIPMESNASPDVLSIAPDAAGQYVEITFDKYMLASSLTADIITVSENDSNNVAGSLEYPGTVEYQGRDVVQKVRFIPDETLTAGQTYTVVVSQLVQSYNDRMMADDVSSVVTIPAVGEVQNAAVDSGDGEAVITWTDPDSEMLSKIRIYQRMKGFGDDYGTPVEVNPGVQSYTLSELYNGAEYEVKLTSVDNSGVETARVLLAAAPEAPETTGQVNNVAVTRSNGEISLTWDDPADSELYKIGILWKEAGCTVCSSSGGYREVDKGVGEYTISGLEAGITYEISLVSKMTGGSQSLPVVVTAEAESKSSSGSQQSSNPSDIYSVKLGTSAQQVTAFDGLISLDITAGTFAADRELTIERQEPQPLTLPNMTRMSGIYDIDIEGQWNQPVELNMSFNQSQLDGLDPRKLGIYRHNEAGSWDYVGGVYDSETGSLTAPITGTGSYAVIAYDKSFEDLAGHWSRENVEILVSRHVVNGVSSTSFAPNRSITRAELAKLLVVMLSRNSGPDTGLIAPPDPSYTDVHSNAWYYTYIEKASQLGLVQGYDGKFRPNDPVSRQEMATMFARALNLELPGGADSSSDLTYNDSSLAASWAAGYIAAVAQAELMQGKENNMFAPDENSTRAELAAVVLRAMNRLGLITKDCGG